MTQSHFGTDGIRGTVGTPPITPDFFHKLGHAFASVLTQSTKNPTILIAHDTRQSAPLLQSALQSALLQSGVNVSLLGALPTPAIAHLTQHYKATAGAIITASHNPHQDNGIKFFTANGTKIPPQTQQAIQSHLTTPLTLPKTPGKIIPHPNAQSHYITFCKKTLPTPPSLAPLKIIIDCANGATSHITPLIFNSLGITPHIINHTPNGTNINHNCGATSLTHLRQTVLTRKAHLGIAFDGDGDRLIMITHLGEIINGDQLLLILAKSLQSQSRLTNNTIVGTQMTNLAIQQAYKSLNIKFIEAPIGDQFVHAQMQAHNAILGGESSGHIIHLTHSPTGDAIIAALQILQILTTTNQSLHHHTAQTPLYPQTLINTPLPTNPNLTQHPLFQHTLTQAQNAITPTGRILIRPSGTQPLLRIMVEHPNKSLTHHYATALALSLK